MAAALYLLISLLLFNGVLRGLASRGPTRGDGDNAQMAWFLTWTPHALINLQNPFLTDAINAPIGVNLMWNTSMPLAGVVLAPVTLIFGPLASLNLAYIFGPTLTAVTGRWWLSRHVTSEPARLVGGLVAGFGFFVGAQLGIHLNFVLLPLVPVMLRLAEDVLWRAETHRLRWGALLGLATAGQALLSEELVAIVVVGAIVAVVMAGVNRPRLVVPALIKAIPALACALGVAALVLAVPLSYQLFGPNNTHGVDIADYFFAAKKDFFIPTSRFWISPVTQDVNLAGRSSNPAEDDVYLGLPLLFLMLLALVLRWRSWQTRTAIFSMAFLMLIALGTGYPGSDPSFLAHPVGALFRIPIFDNVLPSRFGLDLQLAASWLVAKTLETGIAHVKAKPVRMRVVGAGAVGVILAVLFSLVPVFPPDQVNADVPSFFVRTSHGNSVRMIKKGAVIVLMPPPSSFGNYKQMLFQAASGMRFRMPGGYAITFNSAGKKTYLAETDLLTAYSFNAADQPRGRMTAKQIREARAVMKDQHVQAVIVTHMFDYDGRYAAGVAQVYGRPAYTDDDVSVWLIR